jgi:D-glycero-alpha-D-manno-heptose-7-phosphate kinase
MKVTARTATRIDFAGGTLDLYPLYLFLDGGITVNGSISIYSRAVVEERPDCRIHITSTDLGEEAWFDSINHLDLSGPTAFIQRAVRSYAPAGGVDVTTTNEAPKGSGLGASSSLLMALSAALARLNGQEMGVHAMIDRAAAIEAGHLGIPTGKQDYYGAVLGKIHALHFDEKGCRPVEISGDGDFRKELDRSLIVSFTGISHYSGANNWDMLKMAIERQGTTFQNLLAIKEIATGMKEAFLAKDLEKVGALVGREWEERKQMAKGVTNGFIDGIINGAGRAGAWGSKLCGAGGGGCMITLAPPDRRAGVEAALKEAGAELMSARIDCDGIKLETAGGVGVESCPCQSR